MLTPLLRRAAVVVSTATVAMSATTVQAAQIGQQCQLDSSITHGVAVNTGEWNSGTRLYDLYSGNWFRIEGWGSTGYFYYGHGAGKPSGYIFRESLAQSTCTF